MTNIAAGPQPRTAT